MTSTHTVIPSIRQRAGERFLPAWRAFAACVLPACALLALLLAGCARTPPPPIAPPQPVADLQRFPQDPTAYVSTAARWPEGDPLPAAVSQAWHAQFRARWFKPWDPATVPQPAGEALWGVKTYGGKQAWTREGALRPPGWIEAIVANAAAASFPSRRQPAIALRAASLRVLPTHDAFYLDPRRPGEGHPFDYFQNSAIWIATPLLATHQSADGRWLHVEGPYAAGWLPVEDVGLLDNGPAGEGVRRRMQEQGMLAVVRDGVPLRDETGRLLDAAGVGAVLPDLGQGQGQGKGKVQAGAPRRRADGAVELVAIRLEPGQAQAMPMPMSQKSLAAIAAGMQGKPYGWGGMDGNRDCSSLLRDLFTPFGVFLPRNSAQQARAGEAIPLKDLSADEKERQLLARGLPFRTLVNKPGHVMLYIGQREGRAMVYHAIWGLRTRDAGAAPEDEDGRLVIGRTAVTTLTPGAERSEIQRRGQTLADTLTSFTILNPPPVTPVP